MPACVICQTDAIADTDWAFPGRSCPRCGDYRVDATGSGWISVKNPNQMVLLSGWVREQNAAGVTPFFTTEVQRRVMATKLPRTSDRALRLLPIFARKYASITVPTFFDAMSHDLELQAISYSADFSEVHTLLFVLAADGLVNVSRPPTVMLTAKGLLKAEELSATAGSGAQGFVAMSFSDELAKRGLMVLILQYATLDLLRLGSMQRSSSAE